MNKSKLTILIALAALMFTSCEKDDVNQPSNKAMENNKKVRTEATNKSLSVELTDFINDLIVDQATPAGMESDKALLFLEAALNFEYNYLLNIDDDTEVIEHQGEYNIESLNVSGFASGSTVSGSDIKNLYDNIVSTIDNLGDTSTIPGEGDLYVTTVDISFEPLDISSGVHLNVIFGTITTAGYSCSFNGDYEILAKVACNDYSNAGPLSNVNANDMVSAHVGNPNCNPVIDRCVVTPFSTWYDTKVFPDYHQYSVQAFNLVQNFYVATTYDECVKESDQANTASAIEVWQSGYYPDGEGRYLKNAYTINRNYTLQQSDKKYAIKAISVGAKCPALYVNMQERPVPMSW